MMFGTTPTMVRLSPAVPRSIEAQVPAYRRLAREERRCKTLIDDRNGYCGGVITAVEVTARDGHPPETDTASIL
jgi:hypothetical protein